MTLQLEDGAPLLDESGSPLIDEARSPKLTRPDPMNDVYQLAITTTPASGTRSNWTPARAGVTVVSVRGDYGGATKLSLIYTPVGDDADDTVAPPSGEEYPVFKEIAAGDAEQVVRVHPSETLYKLAVIATDNDGSTDLQVVFS